MTQIEPGTARAHHGRGLGTALQHETDLTITGRALSGDLIPGDDHYPSMRNTWMGTDRNAKTIVRRTSDGELARLTRFERATPAFGGLYSIQLSYRRAEGIQM